MSMLAVKTASESYTDVLLIDTGIRRDVLIKLIQETAELHRWSKFQNFSEPVSSEFDFKPTRYKIIVRKLKSLPVIKSFYNLLLKRYMKKRDSQYRNELLNSLPATETNQEVELFLMTETYLNRPLIQLFPDAKVSYMEHGMGDYYHILNKSTKPGKLYCIFSQQYRDYLKQNNISYDWVYDFPGRETFRTIVDVLLQKHAQTLHQEKLPVVTKPVVFILLESVHVYNVDEIYWTSYIDHILKQIDNPSQYHFLLKPHPTHSKYHLAITMNYFSGLGFTYDLLGNDELTSASAEVLFGLWANQTRHVFCIFSSSCYYLSEFYKNEETTFWHSTEFLSRHIGNAPKQFHKLFVEIRPMVENVFTQNCRAF